MNAVDVAARGLATRALGMRGRAFATRMEAATETTPLAVGSIFATHGGVTAGDGGAAHYHVVADEPAHPGKIALANGSWGEIVGPVLPVEAFGALADCPDVSGCDPATEQAAIVAAVTGATNDIQAFQDAFSAAKAIGGATVTYGHGKRYRIAFDHLGVFALVMGHNTTLKRVGGGWLEFDPSLLTGEHSYYFEFPAKTNWPDPGLCAGDPDTGLEQSTVPLAGTANIIPASEGVTAADFTYNVHTVDVDIRCHTRVFWHDLGDAPLPSYRRLRMYGIRLRGVIGCSVRGGYVFGMPNDGVYLTGRNVDVDNVTVEACGYGCVDGTSKNNFSLVGLQYLGHPELSAEAVTFTNCTSRYARDEGLAKGGIKSLFVTNFTSIGDHDRAVEGISSYQCTLSSAAVGEPIAGDCTVDGVLQDGKHQCVLATTTAGNATVAVLDAFWLQVDGAGIGTDARYLFIPRADAAAGDGPFRITAVDYQANTITVSPAPAFSVANAAAYTCSRAGVTMNDANETRVTLRGLRLRNIYAAVHPLLTVALDGGRFLIDDAELENVTVPTNFHGCSLEGEYVTATNVRAVNCSGGSNSAFIRTRATKALIDGCQSDGGFAYAVRAAEFTGAADRLMVRNSAVAGAQRSAIMLDFTATCSMVVIEGNKLRGINSTANAADSFITINNPSQFSADDFIVENNLVRFGGRLSAYPLTTSGAGIPPGSFVRGRIVANDLFDPDHFALGASTPRFYNNFAGAFTQLITRDNSFPGGRTVNVSAIPPTTGRWYQGDEVRAEFPVAGGAERARCTIGGNCAVLYAADGATGVTVNGDVSGSTTIVVSDSSNIKPSDTLLFAGAFTRAVWWVDHATHTLTLSAPLTAASGASVANAVPVFQTCAALAA